MIRKIREAKGLTQKELSEKIGKSEKYVKRLEDDFMEVNPTVKIIGKLAEAFGMLPEKLFCKICRVYLEPECNKDICNCK